jgi:hypothetical protein
MSTSPTINLTSTLLEITRRPDLKAKVDMHGESPEDIIAADLNGNGVVTADEFCLYKEMSGLDPAEHSNWLNRFYWLADNMPTIEADALYRIGHPLFKSSAEYCNMMYQDPNLPIGSELLQTCRGFGYSTMAGKYVSGAGMTSSQEEFTRIIRSAPVYERAGLVRKWIQEVEPSRFEWLNSVAPYLSPKDTADMVKIAISRSKEDDYDKAFELIPCINEDALKAEVIWNGVLNETKRESSEPATRYAEYITDERVLRRLVRRYLDNDPDVIDMGSLAKAMSRLPDGDRLIEQMVIKLGIRHPFYADEVLGLVKDAYTRLAIIEIILASPDYSKSKYGAAKELVDMASPHGPWGGYRDGSYAAGGLLEKRINAGDGFVGEMYFRGTRKYTYHSASDFEGSSFETFANYGRIEDTFLVGSPEAKVLAIKYLETLDTKSEAILAKALTDWSDTVVLGALGKVLDLCTARCNHIDYDSAAERFLKYFLSITRLETRRNALVIIRKSALSPGGFRLLHKSIFQAIANGDPDEAIRSEARRLLQDM